MTRQEYYDLLVQAASDGTMPSVDESGACLYRGPGGKKCAFGILIPDSEYRKEFEGKSTDGIPLELRMRVKPEGMNGDDLYEVQRAHDIAAKELPNKFKEVFLQKLNYLACFNSVSKVLVPKA